MAKFAEGTAVPVEKSRAEIERLLSRYGASKFGYMADDTRAVIAFQAQGRNIRFALTLPSKDMFKRTPARRAVRSPDDQYRAWEQECRRLWRSLAMVIKAKLEAVTAGIAVFEDEFLAHIVMPDGMTVGEHVRPSIAAAYEGKDVPLMIGYQP
jgi:hypothetical protein